MSTRRDLLKRAAFGVSATALAQSETIVAAAVENEAAPPPASEVGSLYPFIRSQATGRPSLSFLREEFQDAGVWQRQARGKLLELLHYAPPPCQPRPETVEKVDRGAYVQETVTFNTTPEVRVPAYVLVPKRLRKPAPAIVALHDHGGFYFWGKEKLAEVDELHAVLVDFKKQYYAGKSIAAELAREGYVVAVIDMFYWGERRMLLDDDPADWRERPRTIAPARIAAFNQRASQQEQLVGRTIYSAGFTWSGVMFWDDIRTVDYLLTRPEVDPQRIGCVGLSVGGLRSCHLAALDPRIRAAVVVGWMTSFPTQLRRKIRNTIGHTKLVPGLYRYLDYPDVATLALPRALLVINGSQDGLFEPEGVRAAFDTLNGAYRKAGVPERVRTRLYDTPHLFNAEMQAEAWEWLRKWLTS
jgi:dienelactone hydrolase